MAKRTQARVYLTLASAYRYAIENGKEKVEVHVDWLADALSYMNPSDDSITQITLPMDDMPAEELEKLFNKPATLDSPSKMYPGFFN